MDDDDDYIFPYVPSCLLFLSCFHADPSDCKDWWDGNAYSWLSTDSCRDLTPLLPGLMREHVSLPRCWRWSWTSSLLSIYPQRSWPPITVPCVWVIITGTGIHRRAKGKIELSHLFANVWVARMSISAIGQTNCFEMLGALERFLSTFGWENVLYIDGGATGFSWWRFPAQRDDRRVEFKENDYQCSAAPELHYCQPAPSPSHQFEASLTAKSIELPNH